jgi:hypothetical protein
MIHNTERLYELPLRTTNLRSLVEAISQSWHINFQHPLYDDHHYL